jgi:hypothetical protein
VPRRATECAWGLPFLGNDRSVSDFDGGLFIVSLDNPPAASRLQSIFSAASGDAAHRV